MSPVIASHASTYDMLKSRGVERRDFLKFCVTTSAALGLEASLIPQVVYALETVPRLPVMWIHGSECTCCTESFIRSAHPLTQDIVFNMISLDYHDTLQAAAGHQAEEVRRKLMDDYDGQYVLAVEGNAPTNDGGVYCLVAGETFESQLMEAAAHAKFVIAWGSCASNGCVQAASPNPTGATPIKKLIFDKPVINVPGCPPIAEVMTGLLTYVLTFDKMPELDRLGRPKAFYGHRVHDKCYRRSHFDAGQFVEHWDDGGAQKGWCLYKMGCRGPTTFNACSTMMWNEGTSFPIGSGHGCIGCSEENFWDDGPFYERLASVPLPGIDSTPETIGRIAAGAAAIGVTAHAAAFAIKHRNDPPPDKDSPDGGSE